MSFTETGKLYEPIVLGNYTNAASRQFPEYFSYQGSLTVTSTGLVKPLATQPQNPYVRYGAYGVYSNDANVTLTNAGSIYGAYGGKGGVGLNSIVDGGSGGIGVGFFAAGTIQNTGSVTGGLGGSGSYSAGGNTLDGQAGTGGAGVQLSASGVTLTNSGSGSISGGVGGSGDVGGAGGVGVNAATGTVTNSAAIYGGAGAQSVYDAGIGGVAVQLGGGGTVNNTGYIHGGSGGALLGAAGGGATDLFFAANGGQGVTVAAGATLTNSDSAFIRGGRGGVSYYRQAGGTGGTGVDLASNSTFTNQAFVYGGNGGGSALDRLTGGIGGVGISVAANADLINEGKVAGGNGGASDVTPGEGGVGVDLAAGATLTNESSIRGGGGGYSGGYALAGYGGTAVDVGAGAQLTNRGTILGGGGGGAKGSGDFGGYGGVGVYLNGGTLITSGNITGGPGGFGGGGVSIGEQFSGYALKFGPADSTVILEAGATFGTKQQLPSASSYYGVVRGFAIGDTIDYTNVDLATFMRTHGTEDGTLEFIGIPSSDHFVYTSANEGAGTDVTLEPNACYCRGTLIRTPTGDTRVEDLAVGDLVLTASGEARPVRWLGFRGVDCTRHPDPAVIWPIRIQASAFTEKQPARDLWVSPGHSIFVDGVLIQAEKLVNGATVIQVPRERVEYWHIELESHDILFAEGLRAESYLDTGNRTAFINGGTFVDAYPDFKPKHWRDTCVPLVLDGPALERAKAALLARAAALGYATTNDPDLHIMADGTRVDPVPLGHKRFAFMLPAVLSKIELRCRSFIPAHTDSMSNDQRSLGLCVRRLQLDGNEIALKDEAAFAIGWHEFESDPEGRQWRWSHDRAPMPARTRLVVIDLYHASCYWAESKRAAVALFG